MIGHKSGAAALTLIAAIFIGSLPAQDLVPVSDITGGSSVFVFRSSSRTATKKFVTAERSRRSSSQRIASAQKINRQYVTLAKVTPRRARTTAVDPMNLPNEIRVKTMNKADASKLFAGVGEYYIDKEDHPKAVSFFREAYTMDANNSIAKNGLSEALALSGNALLVKNENLEAKQFFDEALKYNPNNGVAYFGLAEIFSSEEKNPDAIANYEKALELDRALTEIYVPLGILYYQAGEIAKADNLLSRAIAASPNDSETQHFVGLVRYSQNRNDDALRAFNAAKSLDPKYAEAYYYAGQTLVRMNKTAEAIRDLQQATALKNNYFDAWFSLGTAYMEQENYPEAIKAYLQAARLKNDNIETYANLGDAYRLTESYNEAEARYTLATTFMERNPALNKEEAADVYSKIGYVLAKQCEINMKKAAPCRWNAATRALEKAAAITQSPVDRANLGWAYYNAAHDDIYSKRDAEGRVKLIKARDNLLIAVETNPKYVEGPLLNLGMTYTDLGDHQGAITALTKVVNRAPQWTFAINELGIAYFNNKDYKAASEQFRKALAKDDKFAAAWLNLGKAEYANGNVGDSKNAYGKLKQLNPRFARDLEIYTRGAVTK